jgi:hypothetical protein
MKISEITSKPGTPLQEGVLTSFAKSFTTGLSTEEQLAKDKFINKFVRNFYDFLKSGIDSGSIQSSPPTPRAPSKPRQPKNQPPSNPTTPQGSPPPAPGSPAAKAAAAQAIPPKTP